MSNDVSTVALPENNPFQYATLSELGGIMNNLFRSFIIVGHSTNLVVYMILSQTVE